MKKLNENLTLSNNVQIPVLGLGTWQTPNEVAKDIVCSALQMGYKHIDTAIAYGNEQGVGVGIANSGVERKNIFVTSKIPAECKNYNQAKEYIEQSLERLKLDYIDLMLIHAPRPWDEMGRDYKHNYNEENLQVWQALCEGYKQGKFRAIGVSNFEKEDIENILNNSQIAPHANQICCHVGYSEKELREYCNSKGILVEGYSPIATGRLLSSEKLLPYANKYGVTIPQLCIQFDLQLGLVALPKTTHVEYLKQNATLNFTIDNADMQELENMG